MGAFFLGLAPVVGIYIRSIVSGLTATFTLLLFASEIVFFFLVKARINSVGFAELGSAVYLTLGASFLLYISILSCL